jgi:hypothetical protein
MPDTLDTATRLPPDSANFGSVALARWKNPSTLAARNDSESASSISVNGPWAYPAALLTTTSSRPKRLMTWSTR